MRLHLIQKRKEYSMTQEEVAIFLDITTRHYQALEAGTSDGSVKVWKQLAQRFGTTIDYLLEQAADAQDDYTAPAPRAGMDQAEAVQAAAELSEVSSSEMVRAALDFTDGRADTPSGRRVLDLMQTTAGAVMG